MTKTELLTAVKNRIDELDTDAQVDAVIEPAFEYAYRYEIGKLDKRINTSYAIPINGIAALPEDMMTIEEISPELLDSEKIVGKSLLTTRSTTFTVTYAQLRENPADTDELDIDYPLQYLIILYCCIAYYSYRKRDTVVAIYTNEYNTKREEYLSSFEVNVDEGVRDIYTTDSESDE